MSRAADVAWLALGGAVGVNARHWLGLWVAGWAGTRLPWATFAINVAGSFGIGLLAPLLARWPSAHPARLLLLTGFLGGFTTFSTFALEGHDLWARRAIVPALAYLAGSVAAGLVAVGLGVALARSIAGPPSQ